MIHFLEFNDISEKLVAVYCTVYSLDNITDLTQIDLRPMGYTDAWCKRLEVFRNLLAGSCMAHCNLQLDWKRLDILRNKKLVHGLL